MSPGRGSSRFGSSTEAATSAQRLQLADLLARADPARSDGLAESAIAIAPETDFAYERLIQNALARRNALEVRRLRNRYMQAARQYGFTPDPRLAVR